MPPLKALDFETFEIANFAEKLIIIRKNITFLTKTTKNTPYWIILY